MTVEFINWVCPNCGQKHRIIEFYMDILNHELFCRHCLTTIKYKWERNESDDINDFPDTDAPEPYHSGKIKNE